MTFQYIINHLHEPHLWCIVLTAPHAELNIQKKLEQQGFITYVPTISVRRSWAGCIKEIHIPTIARCVFVYATKEEMQEMQKIPPYLCKPLQLYIKANKSFLKTNL